jgi:two-component system cell cycle response regulator CtrA
MLFASHDQAIPAAVPPIYNADCRHLTAVRTTQALLLANDMMPSDCVASALRDADCIVVRAGTVDVAIALTRAGDFDVIIVDFRPDILGHQAICQLRMAHIALPVLFVSARSTSDAFDRAYAVGADDVAVLPFDPTDLKTRLAVLAGRAGVSGRSQKIQVGRLEIDLTDRYARVDGRALSLYSDEYAAFELLVSRNGAPVCKRMILDHACDADGAPRGNVDTLINRLRRKLAKAGAGDLIQSFGGLGYGLAVGQGAKAVV